MSQWFAQLIEGIRAFSPTTWITLGCLVILGLLLFFLRRQQWSARLIASGALSIAVAFLLSYLTVYKMPQGGSITPASMLPIMAYAWAFGPGPGIAAGLAYGCLQLIQGAYVVHPVQFLMDYPLAFAALGLAGFFRKNLWIGVTVSGLVRLLFHFLSGVIFFGSYAEPGQPVAVYSIIYNGSYMVPEILVCMAIASIPSVRTLFKTMRGPAFKES